MVRIVLRSADAHTFPEKLTTSPEHVQIPAESEHEAAALEIGRKAWADVPDAAEWQRDIRGTEPQAAAPYDRCPTCAAHMPVGQTCGGVNCGLRRKDATE